MLIVKIHLTASLVCYLSSSPRVFDVVETPARDANLHRMLTSVPLTLLLLWFHCFSFIIPCTRLPRCCPKRSASNRWLRMKLARNLLFNADRLAHTMN